MAELTQERLKELLHYNPETGEFTWRVRRTGVTVGSVAGNVHKRFGYRRITIDLVQYRAHRLAWFYVHGVWPNIIDHDNRDRDDNRISNLNNGTNQDNARNRKMPVNNTSGVTGVCWDKGTEKWKAAIGVGCRVINLGNFDDKEEAIAARKAAEIQHNFHENHGRKTKGIL